MVTAAPAIGSTWVTTTPCCGAATGRLRWLQTDGQPGAALRLLHVAPVRPRGRRAGAGRQDASTAAAARAWPAAAMSVNLFGRHASNAASAGAHRAGVRCRPGVGACVPRVNEPCGGWPGRRGGARTVRTARAGRPWRACFGHWGPPGAKWLRAAAAGRRLAVPCRVRCREDRFKPACRNRWPCASLAGPDQSRRAGSAEAAARLAAPRRLDGAAGRRRVPRRLGAGASTPRRAAAGRRAVPPPARAAARASWTGTGAHQRVAADAACRT